MPRTPEEILETEDPWIVAKAKELAQNILLDLGVSPSQQQQNISEEKVPLDNDSSDVWRYGGEVKYLFGITFLFFQRN